MNEMNEMNAKPCSFMNIFVTTFGEGKEAVQLKKIIIPIIQRDYAQGRKNSDVTRVRDRFLESLYKAVTEEPITLDFVYGDIDDEGNMTPLDGQQRLTTLFLLHWYAAKKENISKEQYEFLYKFSYETRYSARDFCKDLVYYMDYIDYIDYKPEFKISEEIVNQAWFPFDWKNDPTISSMLVMLDAIDAKFNNVSDLWNKLKENCITFYFLPIKDMGLTDELYIKMNSRGKPLTLFENFKAELEREIKNLDEKTGHDDASRIMKKIDGEWTDLLWKYHDSGNGKPEDDVVDDEFLRYFKFICDIICYRGGNSPKDGDAFDLLSRYFSEKAEVGNPSENIATLESFFDCWRDIKVYSNPTNIKEYSNPTKFLESFMSLTHEPEKIIASQNKIDIFEDCLHSYSDKSGRTRKFPLHRIVLLYAITTYLQNVNKVTEADFRRRIRIVNNLINNSENEISDRTDRNRMPAIIKAVDSIILNGVIDDSIENNFNKYQLNEEKEKIEFLAENPNRAEELFKLEDHTLLHGQISIIGLENLNLGSRFASLFDCEWDKVDCALMTIGNYGQQESNEWRYQFGSASKDHKSAWEKLFHKSANHGFDKTKEILAELLATNQRFDNEILDTIIKSYTDWCENENLYPWNYYYVKYKSFRPGSYGKMSNIVDAKNPYPYIYSVMPTLKRWSKYTYMPYLKEAYEALKETGAYLALGSEGRQCLVYKDVYIVCENNCYKVYKKGEKGNLDFKRYVGKKPIHQNEARIDIENRIEILKEYIEEIISKASTDN